MKLKFLHRRKKFFRFSVDDLLTNIRTNGSGHIISAEKVKSMWFLNNGKMSDKDMRKPTNDAELAPATAEILAFETEFQEKSKHIQEKMKTSGFSLFPYSPK